MKDFKKLSRDEMKNVKGGVLTPACRTGSCTIPGQGTGKCSTAGTACVCCLGAQNCPIDSDCNLV